MALDIVQVSDIHLSPTHAWFQDNWDVFVDEMHANPPDFVFVTGGVCVNGPDRDWEFAFARQQLGRLPVRWRAIPGNHDAGDTPPDERNNHPLTEPLRDAMYLDNVVFTTGIVDGGDHWIVASGEADLACRVTHISKDSLRASPAE